MDVQELEFEKEAEQYPTLGVEYFAARSIATRFVKKFSEEDFKPLIDKFTDQFREALWGDITAWLLSDTESNLQSEIRFRIERVIECLLMGNMNYINQFVLPEYSTFGEQIREAVAKAVPKEVQDARIADLEKEVTRLKESLEANRRY